ncbi:MAG: serine/threonine-protein kinase Nek, partial [archaeon]|nr:serine/threonine-protein kinase Nek [archaeon]
MSSNLNNFETIQELGKGSFGVVLLVKRLADQKIYALKQVKINNLSDKEKQNSLNEIRFLSSIQHKNIISYKECFFDDPTETLNIVLEYADDGDLQTKIKNQRKLKTYFPEKFIWLTFLQMVEGLKHLHSKNIMHRDLKSANIFLMTNGVCKLGDLNVSKVMTERLLTTQVGTPYYASPEVWKNNPYDYKSDIWSIGCILYEMCCLVLPFRGTNINEVFNNILKGSYIPLPSMYSKELSDIIALLLQPIPNKRPTAKQILEIPFINQKLMEMEVEFKMNLDTNRNEPISNNLFSTIKYNKEMDLNKLLPKNKMYESNEKINSLLTEEKNKEKPFNKTDIKDTQKARTLNKKDSPTYIHSQKKEMTLNYDLSSAKINNGDNLEGQMRKGLRPRILFGKDKIDGEGKRLKKNYSQLHMGVSYYKKKKMGTAEDQEICLPKIKMKRQFEYHAITTKPVNFQLTEKKERCQTPSAHDIKNRKFEPIMKIKFNNDQLPEAKPNLLPKLKDESKTETKTDKTPKLIDEIKQEGLKNKGNIMEEVSLKENISPLKNINKRESPKNEPKIEINAFNNKSIKKPTKLEDLCSPKENKDSKHKLTEIKREGSYNNLMGKEEEKSNYSLNKPNITSERRHSINTDRKENKDKDILKALTNPIRIIKDIKDRSTCS